MSAPKEGQSRLAPGPRASPSSPPLKTQAMLPKIYTEALESSSAIGLVSLPTCALPVPSATSVAIHRGATGMWTLSPWPARSPHREE